MKNLFLVLDGLDYNYIISHIDEFHLFREWYKSGQLKQLNSVVPADSIPSWISIYTGLNPAEHGVIETIDYINQKKLKSNSAVIKGKAFWDKIGEKGHKVFVFNPFIAFPAWDVNGIMVCRGTFEDGSMSSNRPDIVDTNGTYLGVDQLKNPTNKKMVKKFLRDTKGISDDQFNYFQKYFDMDDYDLGFLGVTTPDRLQHFMWKYTDPTDRCYVGDNEFKDSILKGYKYFEKAIERFVKKYGANYNVTVISDHGHGKRCEKTFYINEWLIQQHFIKERSKKKRMVEYAKNLILYILAKLGCVRLGVNFFKKFKVCHKVKNADHVFKKSGKVYAPNFDGVNPFGGICVDRTLCSSDKEYEEIRDDIIAKLKKVKHNGVSIVEWVKKSEDIYKGKLLSNYPDIVYKLDNAYGVDRGLFGKRLFGISAFHEIISGGHRYEGVIMSSNKECIDGVDSVIDIHNKMLSLYHV